MTTNVKDQPGFRDLMEAIRKELGLEEGASIEQITTGVRALNERIDQAEQREKTQKDELDAFADEMRKRVALGERASDPVVTLSYDGRRILPRMSDKGALAVLELAKRTMSAKDLVDFERQMSRDLGSGAAATGAALLHDEYVPELLGIIATYGAARQYFRTVRMTQKTQTYPKVDGEGTDALWVAENTPPGANTEPAFDGVTLTNETLVALAGIPIQLLQDANPDIGRFVAEFIGRKFAKAEDKAGFVGTGAGIPTQQPFTGVLNHANVNPLAIAAGNTFEASTAKDFLKMQAEVDENALMDDPAYYVHRSLLIHLQGLVDGQGRFIYQEPAGGRPATLWGYPVRTVRVLPTAADAAQASKPFAIFGSLQYAMLGYRQEMVIGSSEHAGWANLKVIVRGYERAALEVAVPEGLCVLETNA